ncbi:hypothetical protein CL176_05280 [Suicoccus acidiformans]|uniref:NfeD integral membrane domain-containing protein n=1 Tax=Suicoccus acidiformans TaxID=2036206 RepID=A0A347WK49_9LACT|nr:NfeD family protein [Suicoccus acidiformans]AXY25456.1 hypothetical protein CL176_05280 [Suicoccus acidiformans]
MLYALMFIGLAFVVCGVFLQRKWLWFLASALTFAGFFYVSQGTLLLFLIFVLGIILIIAELYIPDFGILGLLGLAALMASLFLNGQTIEQIILLLLGGLVVIVALGWLFIRADKTVNIGPGLVLETALDEQSGYQSHRDYSDLTGQIGIAITDLRPVGRGEFAGQAYQVNSIEAFIAQGSTIQVQRVSQGSIYVRSVQNG